MYGVCWLDLCVSDLVDGVLIWGWVVRARLSICLSLSRALFPPHCGNN